jgi:hypothetical protein
MAESQGSSKKLIGIVAVVVAVVAISIVGIILLSKDSGGIKTIADLKSAIADKKAINCSINKDGESFTIQATDGFERVKITVIDSDIAAGKAHILMVKNDAVYIWAEQNKNITFKTNDTSMLDEFINEIDTADEADADDEDGLTFRCQSTSKSDLEVPKNIDFIDI